MDSLKHYLPHARPYLEGNDAARFQEYYKGHEQELEQVWKKLISSYEYYSDFSRLIEKYGLYILIDKGNGWKTTTMCTSQQEEDEFALRIFAFYDHMVGVLKCTNPSNTDF